MDPFIVILKSPYAIISYNKHSRRELLPDPTSPIMATNYPGLKLMLISFNWYSTCYSDSYPYRKLSSI